MVPHTVVDGIKDEIINPMLCQIKAQLLGKRWAERGQSGRTWEDDTNDVFHVCIVA